MRDPETGKGKIIKNMSFDDWSKKVSKISDDLKFSNIQKILGKYSPSRTEYDLLKDTEGFQTNLKRVKYIRESVKENKDISNRDSAVDIYNSFKRDGITITGHATLQCMYRMRKKNGRLLYNYNSIKNVCGMQANYIDTRNNRHIRYYDKIAVVKESNEDLDVTIIRQRKPGKWWKSIEDK